MSNSSKNIKFLRKQAGFTQETFAEVLGIKRSLVGAYEEGRAKPNFEYLMAMSKLFKKTAEEIMVDDLEKTSINFPLFESNEPLNPKPKDQPEFAPSFETAINSALNANQKNNAFSEAYYLSETNLNNLHYLFSQKDHLGTLPKLTVPYQNLDNLFVFNNLKEFNYKNNHIVSQLLLPNETIIDGNFYIILLTSGQLIYRRVFDLIQSKNCYLLSSDSLEVKPEEIYTNMVFKIFKYIGFFTNQTPQNQPNLNHLSFISDQLIKEIDRLKG